MKRVDFDGLQPGDVIQELPRGRQYLILGREADPRNNVMLVLGDNKVAIWPPGWKLISKAGVKVDSNGSNGRGPGADDGK